METEFKWRGCSETTLSSSINSSVTVVRTNLYSRRLVFKCFDLKATSTEGYQIFLLLFYKGFKDFSLTKKDICDQ